MSVLSLLPVSLQRIICAGGMGFLQIFLASVCLPPCNVAVHQGKCSSACSGLHAPALHLKVIATLPPCSVADNQGKCSSACPGHHAPALHLQVTATLPPCSVADVQALMLWTNPWLTARVFGGGLYSLVCLRQLLSGGLQGHTPH